MASYPIYLKAPMPSLFRRLPLLAVGKGDAARVDSEDVRADTIGVDQRLPPDTIDPMAFTDRGLEKWNFSVWSIKKSRFQAN
jgi:hypothetical protein